MNLRDLAANAARTSAGLWQGMAEVIDPATARADLRAEPPPTADPAAERHRTDATVASGEAMLVPIDSWTRMLDQLGHLHEAGQQLAEARERAARAETEVAFLKAQLAEAKKRRRTPTRRAEPPTQPAAVRPSPVARRRASVYADRARQRAIGWLSD